MRKTIIPIKFSFFPQVDVHAIPEKILTRQEDRMLKKIVIEIEDKLEDQMYKKAKENWYEMLSKLKIEGIKFNKRSGKLLLTRGGT